MKIRESEETLFSEWRKNREGFVSDGVVSEMAYNSSIPKIVFILKEVNDTGCGGWDLRTFLSDGGRPQSWDNISRWIHGIRNIRSIYDWDFYEKPSKDFRIEMIKSIGVINLKKTPGTHTANYATLENIANEDHNYISQQYSLYDPDVTICGGTGDLFKSVVGHDSRKWHMTKRGIWWYEREINKYVISFSHPEARVKNALLLYGLLDAISEIYNH